MIGRMERERERTVGWDAWKVEQMSTEARRIQSINSLFKRFKQGAATMVEG